MLVKASFLLLVATQLNPGDNERPRSFDSLEGKAVSPAEVMTFDGVEGELEVSALRLSSAAVRIDGRMDDPAWADAALLRGFTQYEPVEGIPASQKTEVRVLVTDQAVLFGIQAFDDEEGGVRATLTPRDGFGRSDDYVRVILDTFNDQRRAFVFQVNPLGVQGDGLWVEGGGRGGPIDWNPDFLWESSGRVESYGYTVEMRIPLKSLRFPESPTQDWGLQVTRKIQRNGYSESWAPLTGEIANTLSQSGTLGGITGLRPGRMLELNPVITGTRQGRWNGEEGSFRHSAPTGDFGFNATYGITSNLTLDATYNPDFSQIESDAGQIAVNQRFALYFPEKRPFFLEGTDVFSMSKQLVYTRSIGNPVGAAKLSGKIGSFNVAYIGAVDDVSSGNRNPVVNLIRVKRDVGASSTVGMVYTDRSVFGERFNRVMGADARLVLGRRYTLELLASGSADGENGMETDWGSLFLASFRRSSRSLTMSASFEDVSRDFRAGSGFIRRVGVTEADARVGYRWRGGAGALVESWGPSLEVQGTWDRQNFWSGLGPTESEVQLNLSASFRGNIGGSLSFSRDSYTFSAQEYEGLFLSSVENESVLPFAPAAELFSGMTSVRFRGWVSRWEQARVSFGGSWSETPIFTRGVPADVGNSYGGDLNLSFYPSGSLTLGVGIRHSTILRKRDGSRYSTATIPRVNGRYQFSRALFVRANVEYSSQIRGDVLDPVSGAPVLTCGESCIPRSGSDAHDFRLEGLLGYEPSPGTVVYVGYTREMRDAEAFGLRNFTPEADGLFVKLSYRFRM